MKLGITFSKKTTGYLCLDIGQLTYNRHSIIALILSILKINYIVLLNRGHYIHWTAVKLKPQTVREGIVLL